MTTYETVAVIASVAHSDNDRSVVAQFVKRVRIDENGKRSRPFNTVQLTIGKREVYLRLADAKLLHEMISGHNVSCEQSFSHILRQVQGEEDAERQKAREEYEAWSAQGFAPRSHENRRVRSAGKTERDRAKGNTSQARKARIRAESQSIRNSLKAVAGRK